LRGISDEAANAMDESLPAVDEPRIPARRRGAKRVQKEK
jgi:hypothetical protein